MATTKNSAERGSLLAASRFGSDVTLLQRLRNRISELLDDPDLSPRDFASLSRRLLDVNRDLREAELHGDEIPAELVPDAPFDASAI